MFLGVERVRGRMSNCLKMKQECGDPEDCGRGVGPVPEVTPRVPGHRSTRARGGKKCKR